MQLESPSKSYNKYDDSNGTYNYSSLSKTVNYRSPHNNENKYGKNKNMCLFFASIDIILFMIITRINSNVLWIRKYLVNIIFLKW